LPERNALGQEIEMETSALFGIETVYPIEKAAQSGERGFALVLDDVSHDQNFCSLKFLDDVRIETLVNAVACGEQDICAAGCVMLLQKMCRQPSIAAKPPPHEMTEFL
jgi:hypothetical protein